MALSVFQLKAEGGKALSQDDYVKLQNALMLLNGGMAEAAMSDFDELCEKYPDDYLVNYERLIALYHIGEYDRVVNESKRLFQNINVQPGAYQVCGNAYDQMGDPDKAKSVYREGLKRFPESGALYLELGNIDLMSQDYDAAYSNYLHGMEADPDFASNYFRAALLGFSAHELYVWGLLYAETEILLAPENERRECMAKGIYECMVDNVRYDGAGSHNEAIVTFVPARGMQVSQDVTKASLDFPGVYDGCTNIALKAFVTEKEPFVGSIAHLTRLRKGIVDAYFKITGNLFGNSMFLLPFQRRIIKAGHWEAYNYFLFSSVCPDEYDAWIATNEKKLRCFIDWLRDNPFRLDRKHTVCQNTVNRCARKLNFMEALTIQAKLMGGN